MRRALVAIGIVICCLAFLWARLHRLKAVGAPKIGVSTASEAPLAADRVPSHTASSLDDAVPAGGVYSGMTDPRWIWWNLKRQADQSFEWKVPINFYGRVVDQDGLPVPDAQVHFQWTDLSPKGISEWNTASDRRGAFSLVEQKGKRLNVRVTKSGYHSEGVDGGKSFEYAAFFEENYLQPDPSSPVLFRLTKKGTAEPLIVHHLTRTLSYDSRDNYYDLVRGVFSQQPTGAAGLSFRFERSESPQGDPFDWKVQIQGVDVALQNAADAFVQLAPLEGYSPEWQRSRKVDTQPFERSFTGRFYLQTATKQYAWIDVEIVHPNSRNLGPQITLTSYLNPSGSRNLEYDPAKMIKAK